MHPLVVKARLAHVRAQWAREDEAERAAKAQHPQQRRKQ